MGKSSEPVFAFFGTSRQSVAVLDALEAADRIPALIITAPDKPRGRGLVASPCPAKAWAMERGIDTLSPSSLSDETFFEELAQFEWDLFVVAAYGLMIPKRIFDLPPHGALNVHPSLLPKFRGPSPVLSAILADERQTGVSIMQVTEKMDAGPVVASARIEIDEAEWPPKGSMLEELLFTEGGALLAETIPQWVAGSITPEPQDEAKASYTKKFSSADAHIDLAGNQRENFLKIQAFDAGPRAYFTTDRAVRVIVADAQWRDNILVITRVIPEGKKEMSYQEFLRGQH